MRDVLTALSAALAPRYRIERELGTGGMATVYLARDLKHERDVAIKVLRADVAAAVGVDRFLAEIKTTGDLKPTGTDSISPSRATRATSGRWNS
jgi:eukaryotic-like serine/threonine-protein kinase